MTFVWDTRYIGFWRTATPVCTELCELLYDWGQIWWSQLPLKCLTPLEGEQSVLKTLDISKLNDFFINYLFSNFASPMENRSNRSYQSFLIQLGDPELGLKKNWNFYNRVLKNTLYIFKLNNFFINYFFQNNSSPIGFMIFAKRQWWSNWSSM